jgi:hypothetical protein
MTSLTAIKATLCQYYAGKNNPLDCRGKCVAVAPVQHLFKAVAPNLPKGPYPEKLIRTGTLDYLKQELHSSHAQSDPNQWDERGQEFLERKNYEQVCNPVCW